MARRALVRIPAQADEGSAYRAAIEIVGLGRSAEEECLGAGTQFEPAGAIRDGGIAVHQMPAMGQHETGNIGLKSEVASGVLVDPESQGRSDEVLGASRRVRGEVSGAVRGGRSDGRIEIPLHGDVLHL